MSAYTTIALLGAGSMGVFLDAFVSLGSKGIKTVVLTRKSPHPKTFPDGVIVAPISNYNDIDEVSLVLKSHGVEVVVSTIGVDGMGDVQKSVASAAKKAGVELFVPSEFAFVSEGVRGEGFIGLKQEVADHLVEIGLPYLRIFSGTFYLYIKDLVGYPTTGKVNIVLTGDEESSFTSEKDVANFTAYAVTTLPPSSLRNKTFRIQGDRLTLKQVASLLKAPIQHVEEVPQGEGKYDAYMTYLQKFSEGGKSSTGYVPLEGKEGVGDQAAGSANSLWEGHKFVSLKDYWGV